MTPTIAVGRIAGVQDKTGRVEPGVTLTENGRICVDVRKDGEPCATPSTRIKGDMNKLAQAMQTKENP